MNVPIFQWNSNGFNFSFYGGFKKTGSFILRVYNTTNQDSTYLIATKKIIVEPLPIPDVILSNLNGEFIGSKFLSSLKGLKVNTPLKAFSEAYKIRSFYISINGAAPIFNAGAEFSKEAREKIQSAKPGNYIIIEDIKVDGADGDLKQSKSIILKVK